MTRSELLMLLEQKLSYEDRELSRMSDTRLMDIYSMLTNSMTMHDLIDMQY